jgi:hypothetical protein
MDHSQFKANQTAAIYVADGLDSHVLEAFEMHLMGCQECVEDVEAWRVMKHHMARHSQPARVPTGARSREADSTTKWRVAASLLSATLLGATAGWFGHAWQSPAIDSAQTVFFNVPALTRAGGDCAALQLAPNTRFAVVRVPGVMRDRRVLLIDTSQHEIPASRYNSWLQPDGSHLLRFEAGLVSGKSLNLETRAPDGSVEPLGCVTGRSSG